MRIRLVCHVIVSCLPQTRETTKLSQIFRNVCATPYTKRSLPHRRATIAMRLVDALMRPTATSLDSLGNNLFPRMSPSSRQKRRYMTLPIHTEHRSGLIRPSLPDTLVVALLPLPRSGQSPL